MNRRSFLEIASAAAVLKTRLAAQDTWRTFEVTTRVEVLKPSGVTRVWVPAALAAETPYQKTLSNTFHAEGTEAKLVETKLDALGIVAAEFPAGARPVVTITSRVATRDRSGLTPTTAHPPSDLKYWLRPTKLLPTDGVVRETALEITRGSKTDLAKARAIYDWIVENTRRDPKTRGCGRGDIRFLLESRDLAGKCADLNALYVGLARAAGLPARDVYGIRVAASRLGYKSLGTSSETISKAQHCRAEVFLGEYGWVAVDPADVRKVMLEEPPGNRPADDEIVKKARERLFGSWEMNWMAYNYAHDVALPGSSGPPVAFLMYPQAETAEGRIDCLDPDAFRYEITSREIG